MRPHLRREREVRRRRVVTDDHAQLILNAGLAKAPQERTRECAGDNGGRCLDIFGDSAQTVTDDVLKQLTRKVAQPVPWIAKECAGIGSITEIVTVVTLEMDRGTAKETVCDER